MSKQESLETLNIIRELKETNPGGYQIIVKEIKDRYKNKMEVVK